MIIAKIGYQSYEMNDLQSATELLRILDESKPVKHQPTDEKWVYVECEGDAVEIRIESGQTFNEAEYKSLFIAKKAD